MLRSSTWLSKILAAVLWVCVFSGGAVTSALAFLRPPWDRFADLHVYYGSTRSLFHDGSLYVFTASNGDPFTYPPFAGLIFSPLLLVSEAVARVLWTLLTMASLLLVALVVGRIGDQKRYSRSLFWAPAVAFVLLVSAPMQSNMRFGQISWFLVIMVAADALLLVPIRLRGIATGVAAAIKLTPLIFIPYYWFADQRRTAIVSAATFGACSGVAWLLLPSNSAEYWFKRIWDARHVGNPAAASNQSLTGILARISLSATERSVALSTTSAVILVLALWRGAKASRSGNWIAGMTIIGAGGVALSPVSWTHHQFWLLCAAMATFVGSWATIVWRTLVMAICVLPVGDVLAAIAPVLSPVATDIRGLLAIAVVVIMPFRQIAGRRGEEVPQNDAGNASATGVAESEMGKRLVRTAWRLGIPGLLVLLPLSACGSANLPTVIRPSGESLLMPISSGHVGSVPWRVDAVKHGGKTCTEAVVSVHIMATGCDYTVGPGFPVNIEVEGNKVIAFVDGAVGKDVATIKLFTRNKPQGEALPLVSVPSEKNLRLLGCAFDPNDATTDLVAYNSSGAKIYSGGEKIRSTVIDDHVTSARSSH